MDGRLADTERLAHGGLMPTYLNRDNKPRRVTTRQLAGFFRAQKEFFSANDAYNQQRFHLDRLNYMWIRQAVSDLSGIAGEKPKLGAVNAWFANQSQLWDEQGNYLTYLGSTVRVY